MITRENTLVTKITGYSLELEHIGEIYSVNATIRYDVHLGKVYGDGWESPIEQDAEYIFDLIHIEVYDYVTDYQIDNIKVIDKYEAEVIEFLEENIDLIY